MFLCVGVSEDVVSLICSFSLFYGFFPPHPHFFLFFWKSVLFFVLFCSPVDLPGILEIFIEEPGNVNWGQNPVSVCQGLSLCLGIRDWGKASRCLKISLDDELVLPLFLPSFFLPSLPSILFLFPPSLAPNPFWSSILDPRWVTSSITYGAYRSSHNVSTSDSDVRILENH